MNAEQIATENEILRAVVGSTVHGLALEGTDDHDEMGICIEPPEYLIGLARANSRGQGFEQWVYRTQPEGARSGHGDTDLVIYSLRKWMKLALAGNPSILVLLFAPDEQILMNTWIGRDLRRQRDRIVSRQAGDRFLGYLNRQRERLLGERGQMRVRRPELLEAHGFDTKYAMHMLRLGYQGIELLKTGGITLPMPPAEREFVMAVRRGEIELETVLEAVTEIDAELKQLRNGSWLPEHPDWDAMNHWLVATYRTYWTSRRWEK